VYRLVTFGGLGLAKDGEPLARTTIQRRQLALLAVLAAAGRSGVSRDKLIGYLWAEREPERARNLLDQALSAARRTLGPDAFVALPTALALNPAALASDVAELEAAASAADWERVAALYTGAFLDGVFVSDAPEFERWAAAERARFARVYSDALEALAQRAAARGDHAAAVACWRRLVQVETLSARAAMGLMHALVDAGDRAGALEFARVHELLVRQELDAPVDPSVTALAERIRRGGVEPRTVADGGVPHLPGERAHAGAGVGPPRSRDPDPGPAGERSATAAPPSGEDASSRAGSPHRSDAPPIPAPPIRRPMRSRRGWSIVALAAVLLVVAGALFFRDRAALDPDAAAATRRSIAVLPFLNITEDRDTDYFSDGFTEELITALSQVPGLRVAARTSSFAARAASADAREIGQRLTVATLLEGSVQRTGDRLRVTAQLVDTRNGFHVWTGKFDRRITDIFAVEDEIAQQIVAALGPALGDSSRSHLAPHRARDLDTYALYLQGRQAWRQRSAESLRRAVAFYGRALAKDSSYAEAWAGLADVYAVLPLYDSIPTDTAYARADVAASRALAIDSTLAEPFATLGLIRARRYQWGEAELHFRRALQRDPNYATAHQWYGKLLGTTGRLRNGETELRQALLLDPLSPVILYNLGQNLFWQRRHEEARDVFERALATDATFYPARTYLGFLDAAEGRPRDAVAEFRRVLDSRHSDDDLAVLAYGLALAGQRDSASAVLSRVVERARTVTVSPADIALGYLGQGDRDAAFRWLDLALAQHDSDLEAFVQSPLFEPARADRRWEALLTGMRLR
jgi:serine/threonine-protein kinase